MTDATDRGRVNRAIATIKGRRWVQDREQRREERRGASRSEIDANFSRAVANDRSRLAALEREVFGTPPDKKTG